jgi:phosphoribosylamine--glycine ligase
MGRKGKDVPLGADDFRKAGIPTIGGGSFCDRLEKDRIFGENIAKDAGCRIPPTKTFGTIGQAIAFASTVGDEGWYFKSDRYLESDATYGAKNGDDMVRYLESVQKKFGDHIPCMLQQKIPGVALSTACWWNGKAFIPPYEGTIEHKKMMNDDLGPSTGCAFNAVWFYQGTPKVVERTRWQNLTPIFLKNNAPVGIYDMNVIVSEEPGPWGPGTPISLSGAEEWVSTQRRPRYGS